MSAKVHPLHTSPPDEIKTTVAWEEQLCALADGQLSDADCAKLFDQLQREADDQALMRQWRAMHMVGEAMRTPHAFVAKSEAEDDAFLLKLRGKLAQEPRAQKPVVPPQLTPAPVVQTVPQAATEAANAAVFRWKMVAGFASLAAVAAIGWSNLPQLGQGTGNNAQTQLAQQAGMADQGAVGQGAEVFALRGNAGAGNAPLGLMSGSAVAVNAPLGAAQLSSPQLNPQLQASARSQPGLALVGTNTNGSTSASVLGADDVMIRDARLDELLARQYAGTLALQPPAAFMRNTQLNAGGQ